jgi:iron(III) transport system substrate-binding protein
MERTPSTDHTRSGLTDREQKYERHNPFPTEGAELQGERVMSDRTISRREVLKASTALAAGTVFARPARAHTPEPGSITPSLVEAARKEGNVGFYTAWELQVAEKFAKVFEEKYPGVSVRVERSGAERIFQRINQEQDSRINAVDVVTSTDPAHFLTWKRNGWLAPYVSEDMVRHFPPEQVDSDGLYATVCAWLIAIGYNTNLVAPEEAPKSFLDLLNPKWKGKIVKAHPGYSGAILTATFVLARDLGWSYFEKLAQQRVMQVQSAADPTKKIAIGERAVQADGNDYSVTLSKAQGQPVEAVYASEGAPLIIVPSGVFVSAPNPNAARLFQNFLFTVEAQQIFIDSYAQRSFHALVKERGECVPLSQIKLLKSDPALVEAQSEDIKARYSKLFGV